MKEIEYKLIRKTGKDLTSKIFKFGLGKKEEFIYAAKLLGFWNNNKLEFESDQEFDVLTEFFIFEKIKQNISIVERFSNSNPELTDLEKENMKGILNFHCSLFEIKAVDPKNNTLILSDLLDDNHSEYNLIDINLSHSSPFGLISYLRLLPLKDCYMTSGVTFPFGKSYKNKLLAAISMATFKKRTKLTTTEMFILMQKKHQQFGVKVRTM